MILAVFVSLMPVFGYAGIKPALPETGITTMNPEESALTEISKAFSPLLDKSSEAWRGWEAGIQRDFGFKLIGMRNVIGILQSDQIQEGLLVFVSVQINAFCLKQDELKVTVTFHRVVAFLYDMKAGKLVGSETLDATGPTVTDGWGGLKDI